MLPIFPTNTNQLINEMIEQDGRVVTFYTATFSGCPICSRDPISDTSTDSFCPVCSGMYWIPTYSGWDVQAHVTWGVLDNQGWETGGMLDNGECSVKFMYSGWMDTIIHDAEYVVVDERIMTVQPGIIKRGIPDVNRVIVKLKEKES